MKTIGFTWGIGGVLLLLIFAVYRLTPMVLALEILTLTLLHWAALVFSIGYMIYAEGYKGFHLAFAPRVVLRANYLRENPRTDLVLLAPLFCMGYIHATRRRRLLSIGLTLMIIGFIIVARILPQPWRGILDAGVVSGLTVGIGSIIYFIFREQMTPGSIHVPLEVPAES